MKTSPVMALFSPPAGLLALLFAETKSAEDTENALLAPFPTDDRGTRTRRCADLRRPRGGTAAIADRMLRLRRRDAVIVMPGAARNPDVLAWKRGTDGPGTATTGRHAPESTRRTDDARRRRPVGQSGRHGAPKFVTDPFTPGTDRAAADHGDHARKTGVRSAPEPVRPDRDPTPGPRPLSAQAHRHREELDDATQILLEAPADPRQRAIA